MPLGILVAGLAPQVAVVLLATSDASHAIEDDYYRRGLAWDAEVAARRRGDALTWDVRVTRAGAGEADVVLRLSTRDGRPLPDAAVSLTTFHRARASERLSARLVPRPGGEHAARLPMGRAGPWEVRLVAERGGERCTRTVTVDLAPAAGGAP